MRPSGPGQNVGNFGLLKGTSFAEIVLDMQSLITIDWQGQKWKGLGEISPGREINKMFRMNFKQMLSVFLAILMLRPFPMQAAPTPAVLGSISSYGAVTVGELSAPAENTLFAGDLVSTRIGSAVIQYKQGTRVLLTMDSSAQFTPSAVQLQKGQMTFRSSSVQGPVFQASSLRLEPTVASSSANVILNDGKASVAVTEGAVRVVDPTGAPLASIQAGEARLFAMASAAAAPAAPPVPSAAAAAPQGNVPAHTHAVWMLALGVAAAGASLGIAGLIRANNANDSADAAAAENAVLQGQLAALQGTITTLQGQITTLQAQIATLQSSGSAQAGQITSLLAQIATLQGLITTLQGQVAALQSSGSAQAGQITSLLAQIATLQAQTNDLLAQIADLQRRINSVSPAIP